jgi:hypothetical protein
VLDYLIMALDEWDLAVKQGNPAAPKTRAVIKVIGGASGGGVNSIILGRVLPYSFPHIEAPTDDKLTGNPFFDIWVNKLDIFSLLELGDIKDSMVLKSLLNSSPLDEAGQYLVDFQPGKFPLVKTMESRRWVDDLLTVFLTLTNLRGIPYKLDFGNGSNGNQRLSQNFVDHADFARLEIFSRDNVNAAIRPDAYGVKPTPGGDPLISWSDVKTFGLATGAFPIGLVPRTVRQKLSHYLWKKPMLVPQSDGKMKVSLVPPDYSPLSDDQGNLPETMEFACVDGGATNNAPVEHVRTALAGMMGRNPRDGASAHRALILIDPFADLPSRQGIQIDSIKQEVAPLLKGILGQSRYSTADLCLAADEKVFSRFMITGARGELVGSPALATTGLGGFQGFLSRDFRMHDYLLGRRNAHDFLANQFLLPLENAYFNLWRDEPEHLERFKDHIVQDSDGKKFGRIIPLLGKAAKRPDVIDWPKGKLNAKLPELADKIAARVKRVDKIIEQDLLGNGFLAFSVGLFNGRISRKIKGKVMDAIAASLKEYDLD